MPLLKPGKYAVTASVADGTQDEHKILHWLNEAITLESTCTSVAAGIAGVMMHSIVINKEK